jgi:4-cresol dehydrogenase (hydroxylating) flavoprotein subunit
MSLVTMVFNPLDAACREWGEVVGRDAVVRTPEVLRHYGRTTLPQAPAPAAILRPTHAAQLPALLKIAATYQLALYPMSRGKNWGWGDACPTSEGQVVLELSALDQIVEINEALGYAVVQPGVTQGQLVDALAQTHSNWWLDCTSAGRETSLIGNILERGATREERLALVSGMEVVLADGTVVQTGYGHYAHSRVTHIAPRGIGPSLDGLFSQSNLGIVVQLALWLHPKPEHALLGYYTFTDDALESTIETLRPFRIRGVIPGQPMFLTAGGQLWFGILILQGNARAVAAHQEELAAALTPVARIVFPAPEVASDPVARGAVLAELGLPATPFFDDALRRSDPLSAPDLSPQAVLMYLGGPDVQHPAGPPTSTDPLDHNYGFSFLWLTCPALGREVRQLLDLVRSHLLAHRFPPLVALRFITGRAMMVVVRIVFDRKQPERCQAAQACGRALLEAAMAAGYPPARMDINGMEHLDPDGSTYWQLVRRLKQELDPDRILAPGRYLPPSAKKMG